MKRAIKKHLLVVSLAVVFGACGDTSGGDSDDRPSGAETLRSEKDRITSPEVTEEDLSALVSGQTAFAFDLYRRLRETESGNLFFSPYSISMALVMAYAGAEGATAEQMADALRFDLPAGRLHSAFNKVDLELARRGEGAQGKDGEGFRLNVVNDLWGQRDFTIFTEYLDVLGENYGAPLRLLDFVEDSETARQAINHWISEQTEGKIPELFSGQEITSDTRFVITNAIYFNAAWASTFEEQTTSTEPFYLLDGSQTAVPLMIQTSYFHYSAGEDLQAVELPYDGGELSMIVLLPAEGTFQEFEGGLDVQTVGTTLEALSEEYVHLSMPRFEFRARYPLNDPLQAMGMVDAFSGGADFSGITGERDLFIGIVIHEAYVSVDEEGTEAAAATGIVMVTDSGAPVFPEPVEMKVDRPFLFLIRDIATGAILFIGSVVNPSA